MPSRRRLQQLPWPWLLASSRPGPRSPPPPHPRRLRRRKPRPHLTAGWSAYPSSPAAPTPARPGVRGSPGTRSRRRASRHLPPERLHRRPSPASPNPHSPTSRPRTPHSFLQRRRRTRRWPLPRNRRQPQRATAHPPAPRAGRTGTAPSPAPAGPPRWLPWHLPAVRARAARPSGPSPWARCWWALPPVPSPCGTGTGTGSARTERSIRPNGRVPRRAVPWLSGV